MLLVYVNSRRIIIKDGTLFGLALSILVEVKIDIRAAV